MKEHLRTFRLGIIAAYALIVASAVALVVLSSATDKEAVVSPPVVVQPEVEPPIVDIPDHEPDWDPPVVEPEPREKPKSAGDNLVNYQSHVRPILKKHCFSCHGPERDRSGLTLHTFENVMRGGDLNLEGLDTISPGDPMGSLLYASVAADDDDDEWSMMPPNRSRRKGNVVDEDSVAIIKKWIRQGAAERHDKDATETADEFGRVTRKYTFHIAYPSSKKEIVVRVVVDTSSQGTR